MQKPEKASPNWINVKFLQKAIRIYKNDDSMEVKDYAINSVLADHIASTMFRCRIDFKSSTHSTCELETLNVVIKAQPTEGIESVATEGPLFETEIRMYRITIPAIHQLYKRFGVNINFAPELIYATEDPFPIIIIEDLTTDGFFATASPFNPLDDAKLIFQRLAKFHAATYYLSEMSESDFTNYNYSIYENETFIYKLYKDSVKVFQEVLETWDGFQHYIPKIDMFMKHVGEIGRKCQASNEPNQGYNVLNHGDFHTRNILIKRNSDKKLEQFNFIDYQMCIYGSPAIDLSYIVGLLKRDEYGEIPFEEIIVYYHQEFVKTLETFGFSKYIPSLIDLNVELLKHGRTNVLMTIAFVPFAIINFENVGVEEMFGTTEKSKNFRKSLYNSPTCKAFMQRTLKSFARKGWL